MNTSPSDLAAVQHFDAVIIGAGFTGLTAAYRLSGKGQKVAIVETDKSVGGLAGTFSFADGVEVEKFYHHWFNNDEEVPRLIAELSVESEVVTRPVRNGMFFNKTIWNLSTPLDLLRFNALSLRDRLRLGLLVYRVRLTKDWRSIEHLTIREWLEPLCGPTVYKVVWEPLIRAKFSAYAEKIGAVWMWKKLALRGATRNRRGREELAYFKGGFGKLAEILVDAIRANGGQLFLATTATGVKSEGSKISSLETTRGIISGDRFLFTPAFPLIAKLFRGKVDPSWLSTLQRVRYLGNICLVLRLDRKLSDTYWLNVNDPGFPFVGVIEHTNFDGPSNYQGSHIAYLSRYVAPHDPVLEFDDHQYFDYAFAHLTRMFPNLTASWVIDYRVWRATYAQPVTETHYSSYVPGHATPYNNAWISTMAQIYPEDRGTNYAIREGRKIADLMATRSSDAS